MLNRSANTTTYREGVAKIELNLPEDLLERIDNAVEDAGETREEFLRRIVEEAVIESEAAFRKKIEDMLGASVPMGGDSAQIIREMRDGRVPPFYREDRR
jgi:predicted DNA-binding protein